MAETATGHAHGKLILCGEHAVVYGHAAIAVGIDRGTTVHLSRIAGPTRIHSPHGADARLTEAVHQTVGAHGIAVDIVSNLPMGRGMGSSAALAVALVRAWATLNGESPSNTEVHALALRVETVFHGTPSGIDNAVAASGGALRFQRTDDGPVFTPLPTPAMSLVVLDSGSAGDTRALVQGVRGRHPGNVPILDAIAALTGPVSEALGDVDAMGPLLTHNHVLLQQLGVSTPTLDRLTDLARSAGATGAKLAGAGGGGVVIATAHDPHAVADAATEQGIDAFVTAIPPTGV